MNYALLSPREKFHQFINNASFYGKWLIVSIENTPNDTSVLADPRVQNHPNMITDFISQALFRNNEVGNWFCYAYNLTHITESIIAIVDPFSTYVEDRIYGVKNANDLIAWITNFVQREGHRPQPNQILIEFEFPNKDCGFDIEKLKQRSSLSVSSIVSFHQIMGDFENYFNLPPKTFTFMYRGRIIKGIETPASLKMESKAKVQLIPTNSQILPSQPSPALKTTKYAPKTAAKPAAVPKIVNPAASNPPKKGGQVTLIFVDLNGGEHKTTVKRDRQLKFWLQDRCNALKLDFDKLNFRYKERFISVEKTPAELEMSTNDIIKCCKKPTPKPKDENPPTYAQGQYTGQYQSQIQSQKLQQHINSPILKTPNSFQQGNPLPKDFKVQDFVPKCVAKAPTSSNANTTTTNNSTSQATSNPNAKVTFNIIGPKKIEEKKTIRASTSFKAAMKDICKRYDLNYEEYRFIFKDKTVSEDSTPLDIGMCTGDVMQMRKRIIKKKKPDSQTGSPKELSQVEKPKQSSCLIC
ncbi:hypothetical protein TRFO_38126 [Tritrichomonas foetus]|uniref:Ubiquitin-like domain-containing protein n=1 Tax=Tritrichomonas foetus TaxID=1144522 RepID=A0A1J4J9B2_9EUKA|nr:hypothetical protein TRFO_38126 [Tritrichomonas foetus]|eukprot:OHS95766.1 hypothetical protein TRFO_38126 [Tritrichomonas foetus]